MRVARLIIHVNECHECPFNKIVKDKVDGLDRYVCSKGVFGIEQEDGWIFGKLNKPTQIPDLCPYGFEI